jgi:hypothetical protein
VPSPWPDPNTQCDLWPTSGWAGDLRRLVAAHVPAQECASSFLPVLPRLIGQPGPSPSGILGCLENKDWAVRRAAGEALRALGLLLGPYFEREGCWDASDPSCVTGWCLQALEKARFDKVGARTHVWECGGVHNMCLQPDLCDMHAAGLQPMAPVQQPGHAGRQAGRQAHRQVIKQ